MAAMDLDAWTDESMAIVYRCTKDALTKLGGTVASIGYDAGSRTLYDADGKRLLVVRFEMRQEAEHVYRMHAWQEMPT